MTDPLDADAPAHDIAAAVAAGRVTAVAVADAALVRIARLDARYNAFTAVTRERALAQAGAIDARRARGEALPPLAGVPYAVKNLFDVRGLATLAGSRLNAHRSPAARDAALVERLDAAGAVLVGALNMDEFAYGFTTENTHYGATRNPHDVSRIAGGSSGGSAAAVAAGLVPLTLGSDTNGSIRVPASLCGIFGLKPTFGRLSRAGTFPFVASFDHVGPFARSVRDLAAAYDAMQGHDPGDPASAPRAAEPAAATLDRGTQGLRVARLGGYFDRYVGGAAAAAVDTVCQALRAGGPVEWPEVARARAAAFVITATEGGALHLQNLCEQPQAFDPLIRDRLIAGALTPAAWYLAAQRLRSWFRARVLESFAGCDVLVAAATPVPATAIGTETLELAGETLPLRPSLGLLTQPISFIGLPVVTVPVRQNGALPIGVQLIAAPWQEAAALRAAWALEQAGIAHAPIAA
jgi:aspartyl-tRNA(Asn)/glutamyl-tRNA(Gln) amidotransferase subunit A